jgi:hypothetical protein
MRGPIIAIRAAAAAAACAALAACALTVSDTVTSYYSRIMEYHPYLTDGKTVDANSVLNIVYDSSGLPSARFEMQYSAAAPTTGKATRTDFYTINADGDAALKGYYVYEYDGSGNITAGKTYNVEDKLVQEYDVTYHGTFTDQQAEVTDWAWDDAGTTWVQTGDRRLTYLTGGVGNGHCRTDQFFAFDSGGTESLTHESAYWYAADPKGGTEPIIDYELYHVLKGSGIDILPAGRDEAYYYTAFSYDPAGNTFLESNYWYGETSTKIPPVGDDVRDTRGAVMFEYTVTPAAADPWIYDINRSLIRDQAQMIVKGYDEYGNCTKESLYAYGVLQEVKVYRWQDKSHIAERSRYVDGGATLEQREVVRYYDATIGAQAYQVMETTTYYFSNSSAPTDESLAAMATRSSTDRRLQFTPAGAGMDGMVAAYAQRLFKNTGDTNE